MTREEFPPESVLRSGEEQEGKGTGARAKRAWLPDFLLFGLIAVALYAVTPAPKANPFNGPMLVARRMLEGKAYLPDGITWMETFTFEGRQYLSYPPMVTLMLVPFAAVGGAALGQTVFNSLLIFWAAMLLWGLLRNTVGLERFARLGALLYVLGTPMIYSAHTGNVWLLMHSEGNFALFLALVLAAVKRRFFWAGLCYMIAAQARYAILFSAPVFLLIALCEGALPGDWRARWRSAGVFALGAVVPLALVLAHQWLLFADPLLLPYKATWQQWGRSGPDFSLRYVWPNLRFYLTALPEFSSRFPYLKFGFAGQSIWFMSPFFLGVLFLAWRVRLVRYLAPGVLLMFGFYLFYWWQGYAQYGSRYMQDLYPLLIPIALSGYSRAGRGWLGVLYGVAGLSVAINAYGLWIVTHYPP